MKIRLPTMLGFVLAATVACSAIPAASSPTPRSLPPPTTFVGGVPIIPGSVSGRSVGSTYSYQIGASVMEVQLFYLREMPPAGWDLQDQTGDAAQGDTSIRLTYKKGEEIAAIFISAGEGGITEVTIL